MLSIEYVAGFFDGEGTVCFSQKKHVGPRTGATVYYTPVLCVVQNSPDVLREIQAAWGGRFYDEHRRDGSHLYQLRWSSKFAIMMAENLLPHCIVKKPQLRVLLKACEYPNPERAPFDAVLRRLKRPRKD